MSTFTWNYRVILHAKDPNNVYYGLHEVHYENGIAYAHGAEPTIVSDDLEGIIWSLQTMLNDVTTKPVLTYDDLPYGDKL